MVWMASMWLVFSVICAGCWFGNNEPEDGQPKPVSIDSAANDSVSRTNAEKNFNDEGIDTTTFVVTDTTVTLKNDAFPKPIGKVVSIMITGVDSRLGDPMGHADANHLLRFFLDSGMVEIISIPRDTYYDAGFEDSTGLNKLTNVRANRGRAQYLKAVAEIAGITKVDYYVEFGFSQAIGLLEMLGYKDNAAGTLRVLRSRQAYSAGDFQRVYNQGQFIRQAMLRNVQRTDGMMGSLALRAALALVETNLDYETTSAILEALRNKNFGADSKKVWVRLKPAVISKFTVYSFEEENVTAINKQIAQKIKRLGLDSVKITEETYEKKFANLIGRAAADSAKKPANVIRLLKRAYDQRAWLQITSPQQREMYRARIGALLASAYRRINKPETATTIEQYLELEQSAGMR
jgi:anionic cell wall polymer biosynthesis LytR-Cps2A-Psr (LCP) family protein